MDEEHEIGDLVKVEWTTPSGTNNKIIAVVTSKESVMGMSLYNIYYPNSGEISYSWEGWELLRLLT